MRRENHKAHLDTYGQYKVPTKTLGIEKYLGMDARASEPYNQTHHYMIQLNSGNAMGMLIIRFMK